MKKLIITLSILTISLTAFIYNYEVEYYCSTYDYYTEKCEELEKELGMSVYTYKYSSEVKKAELFLKDKRYLEMLSYYSLAQEVINKCTETIGMNKVERIIYELKN